MPKLKLPLGYVIIGSLIVITFVLFLVTAGDSPVFNNKEESLYEKDISMNSNGSDAIYVSNGVQVSLDSVYYQDNYIALRINLSNNSGSPVYVSAAIPFINQKVEVSAKAGASSMKYIVIGDDRASTYDMDVKITQGDKTLGSGIIHIVHSPEKATVLTENTVIYFDEEMEIYCLGKHENSTFFMFRNKTDAVKSVSLLSRTYSYKVTVPPNKNFYNMAVGLSNSMVSVNAFNIEIEDADDIIIK